ncbi:MAG: diguanylate cyclase [Proteobacteria bacterium]|nr:diguanylate cyclase [Pseudomonadota bacterium]
MNRDSISDIIHLCIAINERASEIYIMLSRADDNKDLKRFWTEMANEEKIHEAFWNNVKKIAEEYKLPHVFDDPLATRNDLEQILEKVEILLKRWEKSQSMKNALILAYRLEYYMLHPAFEILYHTLKPLSGETDPEDTYDIHINRFIEMFVRYGSVTPELELLGETLQSLWQRNKILTKLVMIDSLTGLLNRRGFLILAKELFYLAQRNKENMGLLMIDIDKFKKVNDAHGHPKGDEVLKGVAESLKRSVRKSDIIGRFGGEEFIILLPAIQSTALKRIADKIRQGVENRKPAGIPVTISVGVTQGVIHADPDAELFSWIAKADECLYLAKTNGRNCVVSAP